MPLPLVVAKSAVFGAPSVFQHTPRWVTAAPPSEVTSPPLMAVVGVILLTPRVSTSGGPEASRRPSAPLAWKSLWLKLVSLVARTQ